MVRFHLGDVFKHGGKLYIVEMVNQSRARAIPLGTSQVTLRTLFGERTFEASGNSISVSCEVEPSCILERRGKNGLQAFLAGAASKRQGQNQGGEAVNDEQQTTGDDNMKKTTENTTTTTTTAAPKTPAKAQAKAKAAKTETTTAEPKPRKESKCSYIDSLLETGKYTLTEIATMACEKFHSAKKATMSTVRARPAHMRAAGKKPLWKPEPEEPKAETKPEAKHAAAA